LTCRTKLSQREREREREKRERERDREFTRIGKPGIMITIK
jgi:hypothetical protein